MCLTCFQDSTPAALSAYCTSVGATSSNANACCVSVVQERMTGATKLSASCSACQRDGICPTSNKKYEGISKDLKLAVCQPGGNPDNDNGGQRVFWCKNNGFGIVGIIVGCCIFVTIVISVVSWFFCPCCPYQKSKRAQFGLPYAGYTPRLDCGCCPQPPPQQYGQTGGMMMPGHPYQQPQQLGMQPQYGAQTQSVAIGVPVSCQPSTGQQMRPL